MPHFGVPADITYEGTTFSEEIVTDPLRGTPGFGEALTPWRFRKASSLAA